MLHFKVKVNYYDYYDYLMIIIRGLGLFSYLQYQRMWVGIKSSDFYFSGGWHLCNCCKLFQQPVYVVLILASL